jgi:hypothetical protein
MAPTKNEYGILQFSRIGNPGWFPAIAFGTGKLC